MKYRIDDEEVDEVVQLMLKTFPFLEGEDVFVNSDNDEFLVSLEWGTQTCRCGITFDDRIGWYFVHIDDEVGTPVLKYGDWDIEKEEMFELVKQYWITT